MKIYNAVTIDMATGLVVSEDSFEYSGPVAECKGDVNVPGPSAAEQELQNLQLQELKKQSAMQEEFMPFYLESMGYGRDESGALYRLEPEKDELTQAYYDRQLQALKGELPVSPAMEKELTDQKTKTIEALNQRLGSNWNTTTAGIQAMSEFDKRAELLREEARRGQISTGEGLLESRMGFLSDLSQRETANIGGTGSYFMNPSYFQAALQPYQNQRAMQLQANGINAQNSAGMTSGLMSLGGTALGLGAAMGTAGFTAPFSMATMFSSKKYKKDIKPVKDDEQLEALMGTKVYNWKYKGEDEEHTGPVTEESPRQIVGKGGDTINIGDAIGLLMSSVKALNKKVEARA